MALHPNDVERAAVIGSAQKNDTQPRTTIDQKVRNIELLISILLRTGVVVSLTIILLGTLLSFIYHLDYLRSPEELQRLILPGATFPHTITDVGKEALHLQGPALVMVGLLLLIATPVLRVAVSIIIFAYQRDRDFVIITSLVLVLLLASFLLGKVEHSPAPAPTKRNGKRVDVRAKEVSSSLHDAAVDHRKIALNTAGESGGGARGMKRSPGRPRPIDCING